MEISVKDYSAPIKASVFKFCVHLQEGKVYCVNKIKMIIFILSSFFSLRVEPISERISINLDLVDRYTRAL